MSYKQPEEFFTDIKPLIDLFGRDSPLLQQVDSILLLRTVLPCLQTAPGTHLITDTLNVSKVPIAMVTLFQKSQLMVEAKPKSRAPPFPSSSSLFIQQVIDSL
jgi:hypothetical protein